MALTGPWTYNNSSTCLFSCVPLLSAVHITVFRLVFSVSLSSLIGGMEDKEREREEN